MRFGHSLVPSALLRRDSQCNFRLTSARFGSAGKAGLRTCNTLMRANDILMEPAGEADRDGGGGADGGSAASDSGRDPASPSAYGHSVRDPLDEWLMGLSSQLGEREDMALTDDLRNFVFGPVNFNRRDLAALNIQRGRDHGLPDYNSVRRAYGLPRAASFADITGDAAVQRKLAQLYANRTDGVDLFVGGMVETDPVSGDPGPLFQRILIEQFGRTRDADRFWYANAANGLFSQAEIAALDATRLADIILRNTNIPAAAIQRAVFVHRADRGDPCPAPRRGLGDLSLDECTPLATHDYWLDASPAALPGAAALFVGFAALLAAGLAVLAQWQRGRGEKIVADVEASFAVAS